MSSFGWWSKLPWVSSALIGCAALALCSCTTDSLTATDASGGDASPPIVHPVDATALTMDLTMSIASPDLTMSCAGTVCDDVCVDTMSDPMNCGACDKRCGDTLACKSGVCDRPLKGPSLCFTDPPMGAKLAPAPPVYKGMCPIIAPVVPGMGNVNTITSSGNMRTFMVAAPANLDPKEKLPVAFLWHWLGGSADGFYTKGEVQTAVDEQRFIAVIPENKKVNGNSDLLWKWPFAISDSQQRMDEEYQFFDDMYACVAAQYNINKECVASVGVSAGALFTCQLASARASVLSSAMSLSGGVGGVVRPWGHPSRHIPMMALWGGPMDICAVVIHFQDTTHNLEDGLIQDGNFFLECQHNCGHGEPPFIAPPGLSKYAPLWQFIFDHPFWLTEGDSPYLKEGIPSEYPEWCGIGKGSAVARTGPCPPPGCPF